MGVVSGCRSWGRQLSLIVPPVVYGQERETPSELVTVDRDGWPELMCGTGVRDGRSQPHICQQQGMLTTRRSIFLRNRRSASPESQAKRLGQPPTLPVRKKSSGVQLSCCSPTLCNGSTASESTPVPTEGPKPKGETLCQNSISTPRLCKNPQANQKLKPQSLGVRMHPREARLSSD